MKNIFKSSSGFTLIELAIVLVIISVLVGSFIGTLAERIENTRVSDVKNELEEIKQALIGYAYKNGHLPCPDCITTTCANPGFRDGAEDRIAGVCSIGNLPGTLPWVTLGLGQGDAWGTRYRYWVDSVYAAEPPGTVFDLASIAGTGIIQQPDYTADATGLLLEDMATNIVAIVFSHGKNTYGGISVDDVGPSIIPVANIHELENRDGNNTYVSRPPSSVDATTAGGEFDDILIWISEFELKAKMVEAGVLP